MFRLRSAFKDRPDQERLKKKRNLKGKNGGGYNMTNKVISKQDAIKKIKDGSSVMIGGFGGVGCPYQLIDELIEQGVKDITMIVNDTATAEIGVGKLVANKQVKTLNATHIGTNTESVRQMNEGEMEVTLIPQGTLAERIRAAGYGIGGFLTPTGVGTEVAEDKDSFNIDGKDYILEKPLFADYALIYADRADEKGNLDYHGVTPNFNVVMAAAGKEVIVEAKEVVKEGELNPDHIKVPHVYVDYIVKGEG